ncbi:MAG: SDR family oxidoreductase [Cyanobacteria bacterium P01_F01_bin.150]
MTPSSISASSPKTLMITGASGFLGWYLCQEAYRQGWQVYGLYHSHSYPIPDVTMVQVDLTDFEAINGAIAHIQPNAIIHAAAQARPNLCETDPDAAYKINVEASLDLAGLCGDGIQKDGFSAPIPCVFISTNQVFDGTKAPYRETDPVSPINIYGEQKVAAEEGMLSRSSQMLVCRMPLLFGHAPTAPSFLQGFLERIQRGERLNLFTDEFRTPLLGADAAKGILLAMDAFMQQASAQAKPLPQLKHRRLHLGGAERLSRYEFGQILMEILGKSLGTDVSCINACRQADVKMAAARASDLSMDSSYAVQLGYQPMSVRDALQTLDL